MLHLLKNYPSKKFDWDNIFLAIAYLMAKGSHCSARKTAAIVVGTDGGIITSGINGTPKGSLNCDEIFPPKAQMTDEQKAAHKEFQAYNEIHAEKNAINKAANSSRDISGATMYCTCKPCNECIKDILQTKIVRIVYFEKQKKPNGGVTSKNFEESYHPLIEDAIKQKSIEIVQKDIDWAAFGLQMSSVNIK